MRDLQADLEICNKATPGSWKNEHSHSGEIVFANSNVVCFPYKQDDGRFIAAAREGWPHAIGRAIKAEAKFTECRKAAEVLQSEVERLRKYGTIGRIAVTEIKRLRQELDKYKRAYAEICHQFNFGDEGDYKAMYDCWLDWAENEGE